MGRGQSATASVTRVRDAFDDVFGRRRGLSGKQALDVDTPPEASAEGDGTEDSTYLTFAPEKSLANRRMTLVKWLLDNNNEHKPIFHIAATVGVYGGDVEQRDSTCHEDVTFLVENGICGIEHDTRNGMRALITYKIRPMEHWSFEFQRAFLNWHESGWPSS